MLTSKISPSTEKDWLLRLRNDDPTALQIIFNEYFETIANTAYLITTDKTVSKDLAQDVFFEIWKRRRDLRIETSLEAYLKRAVRNRTLNYLKANRKYRFDDDETLLRLAHPVEAPAAEFIANPNETRVEALHQAINQLPERCRQIFLLSRFEELSHREIAEQLGISVKTIENQITKALRTLRERLSEQPKMLLLCIVISELLCFR